MLAFPLSKSQREVFFFFFIFRRKAYPRVLVNLSDVVHYWCKKRLAVSSTWEEFCWGLLWIVQMEIIMQFPSKWGQRSNFAGALGSGLGTELCLHYHYKANVWSASFIWYIISYPSIENGSGVIIHEKMTAQYV